LEATELQHQEAGSQSLKQQLYASGFGCQEARGEECQEDARASFTDQEQE